MNTIEQLLKKGHALTQVSDSASLDCELLLCFCLQKPRSYLRAWPELHVSDAVTEKFKTLMLRRHKGEPVAYLIGERGFWSLDLCVDDSTLIPRPETELLVETALQLLSEKNTADILDLGTGTGAIALALASEKPQWKLLACDNEPAAVALAQKNQQAYGLKNVRIIESDWFSNIPLQSFDLIISNPPYIDCNDPHLQRGDVRYEPRSALIAANSGLADIDYIIQHSRAFLAPGARLLFEHGYNQAQAVSELLFNNGFIDLFCKQDLANIDRVSGGRYFGNR